MAAKKRKAKRRPRPALFVGSSVEGLDVAYAIQENLQHDAEVTVWPQGVFELSSTAMKSLADALSRSAFAIFVFTPDDRLWLRGNTFAAVRDNVIFELGLFTGKLGIGRCFIVIPDNVTLRIPTDLTGITPGKYDPKRKDKNLQAALGPFCNQVRRAMQGAAPLRKQRARRAKRISLTHVTIHSAMYGAGPHRRDVKQALLKELHKTGTAYIGNQLAGDPTPNTKKDLQLDFTFRGQRQQVSIPERSSLTFPE